MRTRAEGLAAYPARTRLSFAFERRERRPASLPPRLWRRSTGLWDTPEDAGSAARDWLLVAPDAPVVEVRVVPVWTRT